MKATRSAISAAPGLLVTYFSNAVITVLSNCFVADWQLEMC